MRYRAIVHCPAGAADGAVDDQTGCVFPSRLSRRRIYRQLPFRRLHCSTAIKMHCSLDFAFVRIKIVDSNDICFWKTVITADAQYWHWHILDLDHDSAKLLGILGSLTVKFSVFGSLK